jgi:hypothetical protein
LPDIRLRLIDDSNREDHYRLTPDDQCYYLFEYTSRRGFNFSKTNQLISNLKKSPLRAARPDYRYKRHAIRECSLCLGVTLNDDWLRNATLVPTPPSKAVGHPEYDPRITEICNGIVKPYRIDVREIVCQNTSTAAAHESEDHRPSVEDLLGIYDINENITDPSPTSIGIVDDVLTAGTHFRAMQIRLSQRYPGVPVFGFFVARRVFPDDAGAEVFDIFADL